MFPARLDDKGRMKLPAVFQQYFTSLPEQKLFVTSLDRRIARIYPIAAWRYNEKLFDSFRDDPDAVEAVLFNAQDLGADGEADAQGRILINPELRRALDLENTPLHLYAKGEHVEVLTDALYEERRKHSQDASGHLKTMERAGIK